MAEGRSLLPKVSTHAASHPPVWRCWTLEHASWTLEYKMYIESFRPHATGWSSIECSLQIKIFTKIPGGPYFTREFL